MQNNKNILKDSFTRLIQETQVLLDMPSQEFKNKYNGLIECIDKGTGKNTIEIRLNKEEITISCLTNERKQCTDIYFFFDKIEDEDAFIDYLVDYFDYSFKNGTWLLTDCLVRTKEIKDITSFHFSKQY